MSGSGKMIERILSLEPLLAIDGALIKNYKCDPIKHHVPLLCQLVEEERANNVASALRYLVGVANMKMKHNLKRLFLFIIIFLHASSTLLDYFHLRHESH